MRQVGAAIDDEDLALYALGGLDPKYDTFSTAIATRTKGISFTTLKVLLLAYEKRLPKHDDLYVMTLANSVQHHVTKQDGLQCQICTKKDHFALAYCNMHNEQCFPSIQSNARNKYRDKNRTSSYNVNDAWYPNTRATDHATSDPSTIQSFNHTTHGIIIIVNSNVAPIFHIGNSNALCGERVQFPTYNTRSYPLSLLNC